MRRFTISSIVVLVVVLAVVTIASVLLAETVTTAQRINDKAQNIATKGRGINAATDSVIQLRRTNELALSILRSAQPLQGKLGQIVHVADGIDSEAGSIDSSASSIIGSATQINSTAHSIGGEAGNINSSATNISASAGSINTSAGRINSSAGSVQGSALSINSSATGINGDAGSIVTIAGRINTDVNLINSNLDVTIAIAKSIKGDTGNILGQAGAALSNAACIDNHVMGPQANSAQCKGTAIDTASSPAAPTTAAWTQSLTRLRGLSQHPSGALRAPPSAHGPAALAPGARRGSAPTPIQIVTEATNVVQQLLNKLLG
ncbi:MAG: hypothetical protein ACYC91_00990 [Solirubrobacteraceae bacterium]